MKYKVISPYLSKEFAPPKPDFNNSYYYEAIKVEFFKRATFAIMEEFGASKDEFDDYFDMTKKILSKDYDDEGSVNGYKLTKKMDEEYMVEGCDAETVDMMNNIFSIKYDILDEMLDQWNDQQCELLQIS